METQIGKDILFIRGKRVLLDFQIAAIYKVETRTLNQQVKRNSYRFPEDFMFQLTEEEFGNLMSQNVTSSWGGRRKLPYAFTEHGAVMLASVLNSEVAVQASIFVVRAFVEIREYLASHKELAAKIEELETRYDQQFAAVFNAIKRLVQTENAPRPLIGFNRK